MYGWTSPEDPKVVMTIRAVMRQGLNAVVAGSTYYHRLTCQREAGAL